MTDHDLLVAEYAAAGTSLRQQILDRLNNDDAERDRRLRAPGALAAAAAWYGRNNIAIFPCEVGGKRPLGRLAPNGCKNATTDADQIAAWWTQEPRANIGIATGHTHDVIDVDGAQGWQALLGDHDSLDDADCAWQVIKSMSVGEVATPGGWHFYINAIPGNRNGASRWGAGVDTRALGGYVLAPPSVHPSGELYTWARPLAVTG